MNGSGPGLTLQHPFERSHNLNPQNPKITIMWFPELSISIRKCSFAIWTHFGSERVSLQVEQVSVPCLLHYLRHRPQKFATKFAFLLMRTSSCLISRHSASEVSSFFYFLLCTAPTKVFSVNTPSIKVQNVGLRPDGAQEVLLSSGRKPESNKAFAVLNTTAGGLYSNVLST